MTTIKHYIHVDIPEIGQRRGGGAEAAAAKKDLPKRERWERRPRRWNTASKPSTQGINMKPITNVTDPQSMSASDAPSSSDATPAGVTSGSLAGRRVAAAAPGTLMMW